MPRLFYRFIFSLILLVLPSMPATAQLQPLMLENGDRVVFVGDGLFENELDYGYLEYVMTSAWPDRRVTFRNIGWSGDTPAGTSRDHFTNPPTAYDHLIEQIKATRPTVAFVGYGGHMAFEDSGELKAFTKDLHALLDTLETMEVRIGLFAPAPHDPKSSPADTQQLNKRLAAVSSRLKEIADERSYIFIDVYHMVMADNNNRSFSFSDNGFQLNADGYYHISKKMLSVMEGAAHFDYKLKLDTKTADHSPQIENLNISRQEITFNFHSSRLHLPVPESGAYSNALSMELQVTGLRQGSYKIWVDNKIAERVTHKQLISGIPITTPGNSQASALQQLIIKKNKTYFYQYRPQNETYLVGFREYEQGNNARELQLLEPLIGEMENEIGRLRVPKDVSIRIAID